MTSDRHDLPCWCGEGNSSCSLFTSPKPHLHCFKCGKGNWNLKEDELEEYRIMESNLLKLQADNTLTKGNNLQLDRTSLFPQRGIIASMDNRGISKKVAEKFSVETLFDGEDKPYGYSFPILVDDKMVAQKIKNFNKGMKWLYPTSSMPKNLPLFGQHLFPAGGKYLTITEGEEDAEACYQMLKEASPGIEPAVVSLLNGTGSAERECKENWKYISSFENIILAFDGDELGKKTAEKVSRLFDFRPKIMTFSEAKKIEDENGKFYWELKDSNDYLKANRQRDFVKLWWRSEKITPKGILSFKSLWDDMTKENQDIVVPFPWPGLNNKLHGQHTGKLYIWKAKPKMGKCFGKDTAIRMWDGSVKYVQDVEAGDLLMGDDGTYRKVQSTVKGQEDMFAIYQTKRDPYIVNKSHILCIKNTSTKEKLDIPLTEYLEKPDKIRWKGYSEPIRREKCIELYGLSPYMLGVWLGDGSSDSPQITNTDPEVIKEIYSFAKTLGLTITLNEPIRYYYKGVKGKNKFTEALRKLNLLNNKGIPEGFLIAPIQARLDLLAGIIDTDGHYTGNTYVITQKNAILAKGILDVARSLGFRASLKRTVKYCYYKGQKREGTYFNININGCLGSIPVKVKHKQSNITVESIKRDPTVCGLAIEPLGMGDYYGFILDGNHRFLLEDFTVVHNTQILRELAYCVRSTSDHNVGLIFLEDTKKTIGMGMCALHMNVPIQFPDIPFELADLEKAHEFMSEDDRLTIFDPEDDRSVENVLNKIMYFVKAHDCKFVILDHISMLSYTSGDDNERRFLDKLVADLKALTSKLNICIHAVIHVNDEGKTRGSRAPVQLCDALIHLERDKMNRDPIISNTTEVIVEENRLTGDSGTACKLFFDRTTGRLSEMDSDLEMKLEEDRVVEFDT